MVLYTFVLLIQVYNAADKRFSVKEACQMLFDEVQKAKKDHPDKFFDVKIIYSPFKGTFKKSQHIDGFTDYTKTVVGFDASGFEDDFPLSAYAVPISNHFTGLNRTFQAGEITHAADSKESLVSGICFIFLHLFTTKRSQSLIYFVSYAQLYSV